MIEAAFALPILFLLLLALADLGRGVQNKSQATSSAADGARAAIVMSTLPDTTDCANDSSYQAIIAAVQRTIPGSGLGCEEVEVTCLRPDDSEINCTAADPLADRIRVGVDLPWRAVSPVGALITGSSISGQSTMQLIPQPTPATPT